jgi:hypothetical protein
MWIINQDGFYSAVKKDCGKDELLVRARLKEDLERLAAKLDIPASKIVETPKADYRYRLVANAKAFSQYLADEALAIDYDNFKASLPHNTTADIKRSKAYISVWSALYELQ